MWLDLSNSCHCPSSPQRRRRSGIQWSSVCSWRWDRTSWGTEGQQFFGRSGGLASPHYRHSFRPLAAPPGTSRGHSHTLQCRRARSGPARTSRRRFRGSPRDSGTPHCPGACPGTAHGLSTHHPDPLGMARTVSQRSRGSSQVPARVREQEGNGEGGRREGGRWRVQARCHGEGKGVGACWGHRPTKYSNWDQRLGCGQIRAERGMRASSTAPPGGGRMEIQEGEDCTWVPQ